MIDIYTRFLMVSRLTSRVEQGAHFQEIEIILAQLNEEPENVRLVSVGILTEMLTLRGSWNKQSRDQYLALCEELKLILKPFYVK